MCWPPFVAFKTSFCLFLCHRIMLDISCLDKFLSAGSPAFRPLGQKDLVNWLPLMFGEIEMTWSQRARSDFSKSTGVSWCKILGKYDAVEGTGVISCVGKYVQVSKIYNYVHFVQNFGLPSCKRPSRLWAWEIQTRCCAGIHPSIMISARAGSKPQLFSCNRAGHQPKK